MTASPLKIGFVGLGIMGAPMAGHLARAGHPLYVHTLGKLPGEIAETTAVPCLNGRDVAERSDIVFIMVPDTPDVESALFAQHGIAAGLAEGKTVVDMSSISPIATKRFAEKIRALGCDSGRAGLRRRGRRPQRHAVHHGRRRRGGLRARETAVRTDGQEHHLGGRQRRRPDRQGGQPDHRGPEHPGGGRGAAVRGARRRRPGARAPGADGRLRVQQDPGSTRRAHDQAQLRPGLSHRAAPEGPEPGAVQRPRWACRCPTPPRPRNVQRLRTAARPGIIRRWCARWSSWPISRSASRPEPCTAPTPCCAACSTPWSPPPSRSAAWPRTCPRRTRCAAPRHRHRRRQGLGGDGPGGRIPLGRPLTGLVVTRHGYAAPCARIEIVEAAHPVPDEAGLRAARRMLDLVSGLRPQDTVLCLISGGGSALLPLPLDGLTLRDKQAVNRALLASGATISEMNCVRRHLSAIKGGRLAAACHPARVITLLMSDVPGDRPLDIASGPTCADPPPAPTRWTSRSATASPCPRPRWTRCARAAPSPSNPAIRAWRAPRSAWRPRRRWRWRRPPPWRARPATTPTSSATRWRARRATSAGAGRHRAAGRRARTAIPPALRAAVGRRNHRDRARPGQRRAQCRMPAVADAGCAAIRASTP